MPAGPGRVDQQRSKPLHPAVNSHVIHLDAPLGQQLLHVAVREPIAQVPAHSHYDHLRREPESSEAEPRRWQPRVATTHQHSLPELAIGGRNSATTSARALLVWPVRMWRACR
jgi:hypothetical protein